MARMIPSVISEDDAKRSAAEATIFGWLQRMEWGGAIVLHSLPLKEHIKKSFGEVDFVVICEKGILCVEVKGGNVERKNGEWIFTPRRGAPNTSQEGPYWQVQGNMKSLRKYLEKTLSPNDDILKCRYACCVMTPDCIISTDEDTEIIPKITFDITMKEKDMPKVFEQSFDYWENDKHYGGHENLTPKARERLSAFLRGDFSFVPPLSIILDRTDEQLHSTTNEQLDVIVHMLINPRMMVEGGAGTGKTLLATEQCRKASIAGEKVLYLCFNNTISSFIREKLQSEPEYINISVYTFHELLMKTCGIKADSELDTEFFTSTLPKMFLEKASNDLNDDFRFDRVVIDEGQDLMNMSSYFCINELIRGGWEKGKWTIYYDPNQNIFGTNKEFQETWEVLRGNSFIYPLSVNCRNTKQIAQGNYAVTHVYKPLIMRSDGEEIRYIEYKNKKEEVSLLFDSIRHLRSEGIKDGDIVILSYYRMDNPESCLYGVSIPTDIGHIKFNDCKNFLSVNDIRYFTIKAFKGMESKAVIMIDVDSFSDNAKRLQNYVGMSRARTYLEFIYDKKLYQERQQRLIESLI